MSPVHVIVGDDPRAETMWANAFTGAVDLYRFDRNVDAFERLTAAEAPIDLVVLTPAQRGPFNLTPAQFIARVLEGPLGSSRFLANLHVIVVGTPIDVQHPRVMAVSTLDAAIRLVKFGEVERAPRPAPRPATAPMAPTVPSVAAAPAGGIDAIAGEFSSSVISRIWDAPDPAPRAEEAPQQEREQDTQQVSGGGAAAAPEAPVPAAPIPTVVADAAAASPLFTRVSNPGFVVGSGAASHPAPQPVLAAPGAPAQVGAPGEAIEVATGALQPARPYQLPNGADYRGPAMRGGQVHGGGHAVVQTTDQPVPPALASQVQTMIYGGQIGNPSDPLLVWSSTARGAQPAPAPSATMLPTPAAAPIPVPAAAPMQPAMPIVPMEPPAGAYGMPAPAVPMQAAPSSTTDPFLARAEQQGGDVSFG